MSKISYINKNFDNSIILATIAKVAFDNNITLSDDEDLVLHAIKRANQNFANLDVTEIGEILADYDESQMLGFANNVKGILHELRFIEIENNDEDSITASIFPDTNHKGTDIILIDDETGEIIEVQLKASDNVSYINDFFEEYPNGEILVTEELANKMNLQSSGISNEELKVETEEFVDKLIESSDEDEFWEYLPYLPTISIAIAGYSLYLRYKNSEIDYSTFKNKFLKLSGVKIIKFSIIAALMAIPGLNIITGASVLFLALNSYRKLFNRYVT